MKDLHPVDLLTRFPIRPYNYEFGRSNNNKFIDITYYEVSRMALNDSSLTPFKGHSISISVAWRPSRLQISSLDERCLWPY